MRSGISLLFFIFIVILGAAFHEYVMPSIKQSGVSVPTTGTLSSILDAYVFSNSTGSYLYITFKLEKPVYVRFIAISDKLWKASSSNPSSIAFYESVLDEAIIPIKKDLEPGVYTLVLKMPEDQTFNEKAFMCYMSYPIWINSKGEILVSTVEKAYPIDSIGVLRLYENPVEAGIIVGQVTNIYVYKLGGNLPWDVVLGFDIAPFEKELVNLVARGASGDEIGMWAQRLANAIYESLLNGTSKAYITPSWEASRSAIEGLYRAGTLSLVFSFYAQYIEEKGVVEVTGEASKYVDRFSYKRVATIHGKYDHLYTGLVIESRKDNLFLAHYGEILCADKYAVFLAVSETPYTTPEVTAMIVPNKSLLDELMKNK